MLRARDLGRIAYEEAWALQRRLVDERAADARDDVLLVCEHEPVVTLGRGARDRAEIAVHGAHGPELDAGTIGGLPVFEVERGGEATYHGPGQVIVYPICRLAEGRRDLHAWMRALEQAVIDALADCGLPAGRVAGATGVWIGPGARAGADLSRPGERALAPPSTRKLCSIGVAARRWVTYHGLALNHEPDLSHFAAIRPCGFDADVMTSMRAELGDACPPRAVVVTRLVARLQHALAPFIG